LRAWEEIKKGKNMMLYITFLISVLATLLSFLGTIWPSKVEWIPNLTNFIDTVILAVLALFAVDFLNERRLREKFKEEWFPQYSWINIESRMAERLKSARKIKLIAISPLHFIRGYEEILKGILDHEHAEIKIILVNPDETKTQAINLIARGRHINFTHGKQVLDDICTKFENYIKKGRLEVKLINYIPSHIVTILDEERNDGIMYATIYSFGQEDPSRPCSIITREDGKKYDFFLREFKLLWGQGINLVCNKKEKQGEEMK